MSRYLKRAFRKFLPDWLVRRVKARYERELEAVSLGDRTWKLEESAAGLRCLSDRGWSFVAPASCREELRYFTGTERGRGEFQVLAEAAELGVGVVFDIGAHKGLVSALFAAANPRNRVFSFEPSPLLQEVLREIAALNAFGERMQVQPIAIGAEAGTMEMLLDPAGGFVQTQRFAHSMWAEPLPVQIEVETIAQAAARLGVMPALIKLDIEGYEWEAVQGARAFLRTERPRIYLELHLNYLEERGRSARDLCAWLAECGYGFKTYAGREVKPAQIHGSPLGILHLLLEGQ